MEIVFVDGPGSRQYNGVLKRRIALRLDGQDKDVTVVRLDSDRERAKQACRWSKSFTVDASIIEEKLRVAAFAAVEESQAFRPSEADKIIKGAESPPTPHRTLQEARPTFTKWLKHTDPDLLDVVFGAVMAHRLEGDPVWIFVIGPPGDGKTESLRSLSSHEDIYSVSTLTPGALISGYITDGPDPSLLPKLDRKVLVIKDFTAILEMPNESRAEVMGVLRDAYDGECCKAFGTGEVKSYRSRFGIVAAVTPFIDSCWGVNQQLGERFLRFRLPSLARQEKVRRAMSNSNNETEMRKEMSQAANGVLCRVADVPAVPDHIEQQLIALADFVALCRSEVSRNRQGVVQFVPMPEVGTRVGKALKKLAMGIAMARGDSEVTDDVYRIIRRVGLDCIPSMRARLLGVLWEHRTAFQKTSVIADAAEFPTDTAKTFLDDLRLLGVVERGGDANTAYVWMLCSDFVDTAERARVWSNKGVGGVPPDFVPLMPKECVVGVGTEIAPLMPDADLPEAGTPQKPISDANNGVPDGWTAEAWAEACANTEPPSESFAPSILSASERDQFLDRVAVIELAGVPRLEAEHRAMESIRAVREAGETNVREVARP